MTIGMRTINRIVSVREQAEKLGFKFSEDKFGRQDDRICLVVIEETLPALRDNSTIFSGNLDEVEAFINGFEWARRYDIFLGLQTNKRRERVEKRLRNKKLLASIQGEISDEESEK